MADLRLSVSASDASAPWRGDALWVHRADAPLSTLTRICDLPEGLFSIVGDRLKLDEYALGQFVSPEDAALLWPTASSAEDVP